MKVWFGLELGTCFARVDARCLAEVGILGRFLVFDDFEAYNHLYKHAG